MTSLIRIPYNPEKEIRMTAKIPFNTRAFNLAVRIRRSGEMGAITGFSLHMRSKARQFYVEYKAADGRAVGDWFYEDQLESLDAYYNL